MADRLRVHVDVVGETAARVRRVARGVERSRVEVGDVGHAGLQSAVGRFGGRWEFGLGRIGADGEQVATRLAASQGAYRAADEQVAAVVARLVEELDGSGGAGGGAGAVGATGAGTAGGGAGAAG